jgi:hypothetical protein
MERSLKKQKGANAQPPGWYPVPDDPNMVRAWNGYAWGQPMSVQMALLVELTEWNRKGGILPRISDRLRSILAISLGSFLGISATIVVYLLSLASSAPY